MMHTKHTKLIRKIAGIIVLVSMVTAISAVLKKQTTAYAAEDEISVETEDIEFTEKEKQYIENSEAIRVALYGDRNIISSYDSEEDTFSGITYEIMKVIEEKSGLKFEYFLMTDGMSADEFFGQDVGDIIAPILCGKYTKVPEIAEDIELGYTSNKVMITKKGFQFDKNDALNIVINVNFVDYQETMREDFPNATITYLDTQDECLRQVLTGEADITFDNRLTTLYRLRSPYYADELEISDSWSETEELSLFISKEFDSTLKSIIKKTIASIDYEKIIDIIVDNTSSIAYSYSFSEMLYRIRYYLFAVAAVLGVIIYLIVFIIILAKKDKKHKQADRYNEKIREADEKYKKQLYKQANYDGMTGLLNRNGFYEKTKELIENNRDIQFIILRGDIDQFKVFNDIMGVHMGDELIRHMADMWRAYFGSQMGTYGYLGGDDYICCYPYQNFDRDTVAKEMKMWLEKFQNSYTFSVSLGGYVIDDAELDVNIMCDRAELALSKAKNSKDIHFCLYEESMREKLVNERKMISYIPTAFEQEQFEVYLQPQYDSESGKIAGAEALIRWNHPERGIVSPGEFIPIMEENGLITTMDKYVVEHTCDIINDLTETMEIDDAFSIAVNLSRIDTFNNQIIEWIIETLDRKKVPMNRMRLEITESAYIEHQEQVSDFVRELKERGFIIEMDDFGSGYSSLNTLKDIPVDTIKMDLKFLAGDNTGKGGIIMNSIIRMARLLDIPVIAEGVETQSQAEYLRSTGCQYMQGYHFSKPVRVSDFKKLLEKDGTDGVRRNVYKDGLKEEENIFDTNNMAANILEKIGPMAVVEYYQDNLEGIMINDEFFEMSGVGRKEFEKYSMHMQDYISNEKKTELFAAIDRLEEKKTEIIDGYIEKEGIKYLLRIHIRLLSTLKNRKTILLLFEYVNS